jgi:hypothetical protein
MTPPPVVMKSKVLVTRSTLAKLLLTDPRTQSLRGFEPVAFLLTGNYRRLPLFDPESISALKDKVNQIEMNNQNQ